ncbi:MAG: hypothetical protein K2X38_02180 [Gemmataceae bacterium]|nr:hypothetical protein [Gemmataceae bacterium]
MNPIELPQDNWTIEQLAETLRACGIKTAEIAWIKGRCALISKGKYEGSKPYKEWLAEMAGMAYSTIAKYRQLATAITFEQIKGLTLDEAFRKAGIASAKPKPKLKGERPQPRIATFKTKGLKGDDIDRMLLDLAKTCKNGLLGLRAAINRLIRGSKAGKVVAA